MCCKDGDHATSSVQPHSAFNIYQLPTPYYPVKTRAHCKNYWQLSITSPSVDSCYNLVQKNVKSGRCPSSGQGFFAYGRVTSKHWECMCCKDGDHAMSRVQPHSAFTIYQKNVWVPFMEEEFEELDQFII
jgi:hypothetical protein